MELPTAFVEYPYYVLQNTFSCVLSLRLVVQYVFLGADEGLYSLQLTNTNDPVMEQVYPRSCHWLYIFNNVLVSISGE